MQITSRMLDEVAETAKTNRNEDFIVGYRFSPEEAESPGISMEITETLIKKLIEKPLDYLHVSLMDIHSKTREGQYKGQERIKLILVWIIVRMPREGIG